MLLELPGVALSLYNIYAKMLLQKAPPVVMVNDILALLKVLPTPLVVVFVGFSLICPSSHIVSYFYLHLFIMDA